MEPGDRTQSLLARVIWAGLSAAKKSPQPADEEDQASLREIMSADCGSSGRPGLAAVPPNRLARRSRPGEHGRVTAEPFRVDVDGSILHGTRWAGQRPAVVLLHAGVCDRRSWEEVGPRLSPAHEVIAYDRRAYGDTRPSSEPFTHLEDLLAVLDAVTDGPVWLVGSSIGGALAIDAALLAPERVAGLVLFAPAVGGAAQPAEYDPATRRIDDLVDTAMAAGDLDEVNRLETWVWLAGPGSPEFRVSGPARDLALAMNAVVLRNAVPEDAGARSVDAWSRLPEIKVPVTVACGDLDVPFLVRRCQELAARLPDARSRILRGTAHLPYLERPDLVAQVISEAVARA
jgi:pimeloyl-ACP methyl ester carboxylesterase